MNRENKLAAEGWKKKFTTDEPRLSEALEEYQELDFEVHLEPFDPQAFSEGCNACLCASPDRYKTIYIRQKK